MTVRMLVSKLKKMPPSAHVVWRDHDQNEGEMNGFLRCVEEAPDALYETQGKVNGLAVNGPSRYKWGRYREALGAGVMWLSHPWLIPRSPTDERAV